MPSPCCFRIRKGLNIPQLHFVLQEHQSVSRLSPVLDLHSEG